MHIADNARPEQFLQSSQLKGQESVETCQEVVERILRSARMVVDADWSKIDLSSQETQKEFGTIKRMYHGLMQLPPHSSSNDLQFFRSSGGLLGLDEWIGRFMNRFAAAFLGLSPQGQMERLEAVRKEAEEKLLNIRQIAESIAGLAKEIAIGKHAEFYRTTAEQFDGASKAWLTATGVSCLLFFGITVALFIDPLDASSRWEFAGKALARAFLYGAVLTGALWCGRMYRSNRHNYVVNLHRQRALESYAAFAAAAGPDVQTKNALLLQATGCIYSHVPTGYTVKETAVLPTLRLAEVFRQASSDES